MEVSIGNITIDVITDEIMILNAIGVPMINKKANINNNNYLKILNIDLIFKNYYNIVITINY